jgi:hypothetical protein
MLDNGTAAYLQKFQDRISNLTNPTANPGMTTPYGTAPQGNASTGYALNNDYGVGNKVYNGFSPSPQVGAGSVNPAGYALRDSQAAVKNDLLSQKIGG